MSIRPTSESRSCAFCKREPSKDVCLKACSACKKAFYCSTPCQKKDWKEHKVSCLRKEASNEISAVSDDLSSKIAAAGKRLISAEGQVLLQQQDDGTLKNVSPQALVSGKNTILYFSPVLKRLSRMPPPVFDQAQQEIADAGYTLSSREGVNQMWPKIVRYWTDQCQVSEKLVNRILNQQVKCPLYLQDLIADLNACKKGLEELKKSLEHAPERYLDELRALAQDKNSDLNPLLRRLEGRFSRECGSFALGRRKLDMPQINRLDPRFYFDPSDSFADIKKVFYSSPDRLQYNIQITDSKKEHEQFFSDRRSFAKGEELGISTGELDRAFQSAHGYSIPEGSEVVRVLYVWNDLPVSSYIMVLPPSFSDPVLDVNRTEVYVQTPLIENHKLILQQLSTLMGKVSRLNREQFKDEEEFVQNVKEITCQICFFLSHAGLYKSEAESMYIIQSIQELILAFHGYNAVPSIQLYHAARWGQMPVFQELYFQSLKDKLVKKD